MTFSDKLPPHNLEAEEAVVGSVLIDGDLIKGLSLSPDDFYDECCQQSYNAMLELKNSGVGINQITLAQKLQEQDKLSTVGGAAFLSHLISVVPTSLDCEYYADIVKRLSLLRQMIVTGGLISSLGLQGGDDAGEVLAKADGLLLKLRQKSGSVSLVTPKERVQRLWERYETLYKTDKGVAHKTGYLDLDRMLGGGFFPGDFIILAARPSMGKTTLAECIANNVGKGENVLFCSGEMDIEGLGDRDVARQVQAPIGTIRFGGYDEALYQTIIDKALPHIGSLNIYHLECAGHGNFTTSKIYQAAFEMKAREGLSLLVIDYIGLLTDAYGRSENERIAYVSRNLKEAARSLGVPILALHQLNRAVEGRDDKRPRLHDLRDSGSLEQDADIVMFLYRDSYYKETDSKVAHVFIAKQRQGEGMKIVDILWGEKDLTYKNLAREGDDRLL